MYAEAPSKVLNDGLIEIWDNVSGERMIVFRTTNGRRSFSWVDIGEVASMYLMASPEQWQVIATQAPSADGKEEGEIVVAIISRQESLSYGQTVSRDYN